MDLVAGGSIISSQDILTQYILSRYINMCGGSLYAVASSLNQALGTALEIAQQGFSTARGLLFPLSLCVVQIPIFQTSMQVS